MKTSIQRPKGTADVLPWESYVWHYMEDMLRDTGRLFGYRETRFPTFEHTELFLRGVGETTDVVQKEMYTFEDKKGRSITLRPEGTASTARSYIENGAQSMGAPFKAYYIAPNFRYEQPQAGRLREHHQFGIECFGAIDPSADAEVIALADHFIRHLQIECKLKINSIGCPKCRPDFHKALTDYFKQYEDELCDTCKERLTRNPLRLLDCKSEICSKIAKGAPRSVDFLCPECDTHFEGLKGNLDAYAIDYEVDTGIVRGLDYYTKTVFEFVTTNIGAQGTVCGGGRYDGLIEEVGGKSTPGVGFGSGIERLIMAAVASGFVFPEPKGVDVYLAGADEQGRLLATSLAGKLRASGVSCETDLCARGVKAQLKYADRIGARYMAVIGEAEAQGQPLSLKDMATGEPHECAPSAEAIKAAVR